MTMCRRAALTLLLLLLGLRPAGASVISINEITDSGGTIINDGSGDVSSTNGSSTGFTSFMSALGLTDATLASDLANLHVVGSITDPTVQGPLPATSATLNGLRIFGTLATPCIDCATPTSVGFSIPSQFNESNVLFAFAIVGGFPQNMPWGATPGGLASPIPVALGEALDFQLTPEQIAFIVNRMQGYSVGDVRIGLGASSTGLTGDPDFPFEGVLTRFEIQPVQPVPEPGTLLLLGSGMVMAGIRRLRRTPRH